MCGFVISNQNFDPSVDSLKATQNRGPDHTNTHHENGIQFTHYLLSLVQPMTPQPWATGNVTVIFNGEIYNFRDLGDFSAEIECIASGYENEGISFFRQLDGEYVIVLIDWIKSKIIVAMDTFGTKPISMGVDQDANFVIASLPSALQLISSTKQINFSPNSITSICLNKLKVIEVQRNVLFSLIQHKQSFDDWCTSFEAAVAKRTRVEALTSTQLFIGLSTGYDSGAIAAALCSQKRPFVAFSVFDKQLANEYSARSKSIADLADHVLLRDTRRQLLSCPKRDVFHYQIYSQIGDYVEENSTETDSGGLGLQLVCQKAKVQGLSVYLSGSGADETISDYGFGGTRIYPHSNFGGRFPGKLQDIFPWPSFFGSTMRSYLMKEEFIAGSYGIEGRYPFLDAGLVQEYFSLTTSLKNSEYKAPIAYYLRAKNFPFNPNTKLGF